MSNDLLVIDMPIEPIENRYSIQWAKWFKEAYERNGMSYLQIPGCMNNDPLMVNPKMFLDPLGTWNWKFPQLNRAMLEISRSTDPIVIFLHDGWFPGIECFKYYAHMQKRDIRIVSFWHCGAYEPTDPLAENGLGSWMINSERSWFKLSDAICCGTEYSKRHLLAALGQKVYDEDKIHVTGYPIEVPPQTESKKHIVVWPHRLSPEKQPEIFDKLAKEREFAGVDFIKTQEVCKTKAEYYDLLDRAFVAVSTSRLETFGIAMVEAAMMGCHPVVPFGMSYNETMELPSRYDDPDSRALIQYHDYAGLVRNVRNALNCKNYPFKNPYLERYAQKTVTDNICKIIKDAAEQ